VSVTTDDGVELHVEATGSGPDVLFLHEFSGNHASWEPQVRHLAKRYRCITYSARGFLPSAVPKELEMYSQDRAVADAASVLDAVDSSAAHVVGLSMGGFTALNLALEQPERVRSVVAGACGYGAGEQNERFRTETESVAGLIRSEGMARLATVSAESPYRLALKTKDPRAFADWKEALAGQAGVGLANTIIGVQRNRPTLPELGPRLAKTEVPILLVVGDEDDPCLDANLELKRECPQAGLFVFAKTAHTVNLEEPDGFNRVIQDFISWCDAGTWPRRDPRSQPSSGGWIR
jgi:pimeloyl-ACP methyl ester carboxylesterase